MEDSLVLPLRCVYHSRRQQVRSVPKKYSSPNVKPPSSTLCCHLLLVIRPRPPLLRCQAHRRCPSRHPWTLRLWPRLVSPIHPPNISCLVMFLGLEPVLPTLNPPSLNMIRQVWANQRRVQATPRESAVSICLCLLSTTCLKPLKQAIEVPPQPLEEPRPLSQTMLVSSHNVLGHVQASLGPSTVGIDSLSY